jgi:hypothetical protein
MHDLVALSIIQGQASEARSARPDAPVVADAVGGRRSHGLRRSLATTLRTAATAERRFADRLDPVACTPAAAHG